MSTPRCWGFRISVEHIPYLAAELAAGRLRQGWGYDPGQDLRNMTVDRGAGRNRRMLHVNKGDLLLVPRLPRWEHVAVVEATEDWNSGYQFCIDAEHEDFGHIFPAKYLVSFVRGNPHVSGDIRATLRNPSRFWNIDHLYEDLQAIRNTPPAELEEHQAPLHKAQGIAARIFNDVLVAGNLEGKLFDELNRRLEGKDWEPVLSEVLGHRYPTGIVSVVQGTSEAQHGTDVLVRLPDVTGEPRYAIAIQIKDHAGKVNRAAMDQVDRADFWSQDGLKLIQKVVVFTQATPESNPHLVDELENSPDVQILFREDLRRILRDWAFHHISTIAP